MQAILSEPTRAAKPNETRTAKSPSREQSRAALDVPTRIRCLALLLATVLTAAWPADTQAQQGNLNPGVLSPQSSFRGLSYAEWGAQWWTTLFGLPVVDGNHPYLTGGAFGGDNGVVFLAALPGGVTLDVTVPSGTALFFPVMNAECSVFEPDPFHGDDEAELRACANGHLDNTSGLFAVIDGVPVQNLEAYRVESPLFTFTLPEDNLFEFFGLEAPAGTTSPAVDAGIYVLLAPLAPGIHTIHVGGTFDHQALTIDTTFRVTVVPDTREP